MIEHRGYTIEVDPRLTEFGSRIAYIKQSGLTLTKVTGVTQEAAGDAAKTWIDWLLASLERTVNDVR